MAWSCLENYHDHCAFKGLKMLTSTIYGTILVVLGPLQASSYCQTIYILQRWITI